MGTGSGVDPAGSAGAYALRHNCQRASNGAPESAIVRALRIITPPSGPFARAIPAERGRPNVPR